MSDVVRQVDGFEVSAERIAAAVKSQPSDNVVIVAAHNGPFGLGSLHHNICGADFKPKKAGNPCADFFFRWKNIHHMHHSWSATPASCTCDASLNLAYDQKH